MQGLILRAFIVRVVFWVYITQNTGIILYLELTRITGESPKAKIKMLFVELPTNLADFFDMKLKVPGLWMVLSRV